jgi:hypothetical protein
MPVRQEPCPNMNHGRFNPPVRFCPDCSQVVNTRIVILACGEEKHAKQRRERSTFCSDCGERLMR